MRPTTIELPGATALVTGAGSGIGRATALALAREGATVLSVDRDALTAATTAESCRDHGVEAAAYACDVADQPAVADLAARVHREHGPLDVLVNNAGVGLSGGLADMSIDDWRWIRSVNLDGVLHGCHAFGPAMLAAGRGHVVNVSSGLGYIPRSTEAAYCTTKAAVLMLSRCLRADWRRRGVAVSAVCPGVIRTSILEGTRFRGEMSTGRAQRMAHRTFRRGHPPEAVADAVLSAIQRNRSVLPVGVEAWLGWYASRLAPLRVVDLLARPLPGAVPG